MLREKGRERELSRDFREILERERGKGGGQNTVSGGVNVIGE
jgi:hypothetical protein